MAYILDIPFAYFKCSNIIDSYLGHTQKNIDLVFEYAKGNDCVLMIDEIDAIGLKRGSTDVGEMARIVISLMQSIDTLGNNVILIGASNRKDMIDEALLRRFSLAHEVKKPTSAEQAKLIVKFMEDVGVVHYYDDILSYCETEHTQAKINNDIVQALAQSFQEDTMFKLTA